MKKYSIFFILAIFSFSYCSKKEQVAPKQVTSSVYFEGERVYKTHCQSCHQPDGNGFNKMYPPLAKSDYLMKDLGRATKIIIHGTEEKINVNGVEYQSKMPEHSSLSNNDLAALMTYITNSWGNKHGDVTVEDIQKFSNEK